jgi:hypothetical protein
MDVSIVHIVACLPKARIVKPGETAVVRGTALQTRLLLGSGSLDVT